MIIMQILVGTTAYAVDPACEVDALKLAIENREFIPASRIRLMIGGRVLEGGTLEGNGVEEDDELVLGLEVPSGMRYVGGCGWAAYRDLTNSPFGLTVLGDSSLTNVIVLLARCRETPVPNGARSACAASAASAARCDSALVRNALRDERRRRVIGREALQSVGRSRKIDESATLLFSMRESIISV